VLNIQVNNWRYGGTQVDVFPQVTPEKWVKVSSQLSPAPGEGGTAVTEIVFISL